MVLQSVSLLVVSWVIYIKSNACAYFIKQTEACTGTLGPSYVTHRYVLSATQKKSESKIISHEIKSMASVIHNFLS